MSFLTSCKALTALFGLLFLILLFAPAVIVWVFGVPQSETANLMARRAAMLFLGLAIISWKARAAPRSELRHGFCIAIAVLMVGLAATGLYEFLRGFAGWPILLAVLTEVCFAAVFLRHVLDDQGVV